MIVESWKKTDRIRQRLSLLQIELSKCLKDQVEKGDAQLQRSSFNVQRFRPGGAE